MYRFDETMNVGFSQFSTLRQRNDRKWPVSDTCRADYILGNDNNRFGIYDTVVDVVEPCARLAGGFLGRR